MKKKIAIIGAGVAGLTLGNLIKKNSSFEFMIYEKNETLLPENSYGIQLAVNSVSILNKIGFKKLHTEKIYHPKKLNFYSINADKICDLNLTKYNTNEAKYTTIQRSTLIEFLKDEIYTQYLRFGKKIKKVSELQDKILIEFDDDTNDLVDYLIAADGIFSNTRSFFEKIKNKPKFKNAIAIRTIFKSENNIDFDKKNINLFMGSNAHLVIYPISNKKDLNLACIVRSNKFDPGNIKDLINKKVLNQNLHLKYLFQGDLKFWPLYSTSTTIPSSNKKVFYLGDAFHGFLPTMAQGASQSIEGAYELFNLLKDNNENAHNIYFKNRTKRVKIIKRRTDLNFSFFHISSAIFKSVRNIILKRLVKSESFVNNYLGKVYKD
jgi:salicylate hydroxylase|tara:strand:- start:200 stop:1333 length:1134 start_codon:yes stop_codon:yes gene_type:complete